MVPLDTPQLHELVSRIQGGDGGARDELIRCVQGRLGSLARRLLRGFPRVRRNEETQDVLQQALWRLVRALQEIRPASTRDFYNLAAVQIRRVLLDLARHYQVRDPGDQETLQTRERYDPEGAPDHLEPWTAFHEAAAALADEEREVFDLLFYHGWQQRDAADLLGIDVRTVRRRWQSACLRLRQDVGHLPLS
jgi:RNA polymerase sigma-70 factor (ECF subfamily)